MSGETSSAGYVSIRPGSVGSFCRQTWRVSFSYLNLIEDVFPSLLNETNAMDVIFCRNVLLYFNKEGAIKVLDGFFNSLVEGGWFIPGMSELSHLKSPKFQSVNYPDSILYRKISVPAAAQA
jgi:chemotaxis protein methyltransferase CheR